MKSHLKRLLLLAMLVCLSMACAGDAEAARKKARRAQPDRYASIVIDANTGYVLSERNADKQLHPASLTKMMTLYLTFEAIANGNLSKNQRIGVSKRAAQQEPSKLNLKPGGTIRVEDAILALVTKSANDVAVVLAEAIAGSESRFGALMTQKAKQLGMTRTRFVNASGLHNPAQVSTARDMARLSQALLKHYPREYRYFSTNNFTYAGVSHRNHNRLMSTYTGMDGIKTGYVYASGYNLAASAARNGRRLVGVVFGGRTTHTRNAEMARLLDAGFANASKPAVASRIAKQGTQVAARRPTQKPQTLIASNTVSRQVNIHTPSMPQPAFNALALVPREQGDTDDEIATSLKPAKVIHFRQPQPIKNTGKRGEQTASAARSPVSGQWAVQVGAFATHDAGLIALRGLAGRLPQNVRAGGQPAIAPLMTNRGMIYRARLAGLGRDQATEACRILKGSCLILAVQ